MFDLEKIFGKNKNEAIISKDKIARMLHVSPEALTAFEDAYRVGVLDDNNISDNMFEINAKQAAKMNPKKNEVKDQDNTIDEMVSKIVNELLAQAITYMYDGDESFVSERHTSLPATQLVTNKDILVLPEDLRPQLTGTLAKKDLAGDSYPELLTFYKMYQKENNPKKKMMFYHHFRQGLDILDLDPITYEIIGMNKNSMGYWLPPLVEAVKKQHFFKIPKTTVLKVPMTLLQLTHLDYTSLTSTTLSIVDEFCMKAFNLDESKDYFIKTGTYSSKFDFRNAHVHGAKEVRELGEYLLYIHFQALMMAGPLCKPCIYGVSTTNEWVVREFIKDKENNPCIYKGLPLHTEYRVFVDFDTNEVLGIAPYWKPDVMEKRFAYEGDANSPHQIHDYIIYKTHKDILISRYENNKDKIKERVEEMLPNINLSGQWSIDIMQNEDDFWIIDMALAKESALNDCIPEGMLKDVYEDWIPKLPDITE